jgi:predicted nucleic acid-binding Zn ribbon protein
VAPTTITWIRRCVEVLEHHARRDRASSAIILLGLVVLILLVSTVTLA